MEYDPQFKKNVVKLWNEPQAVRSKKLKQLNIPLNTAKAWKIEVDKWGDYAFEKKILVPERYFKYLLQFRADYFKERHNETARLQKEGKI